MVPLRSAWRASTTKNSAVSPLAVCSITHGAILRWNATSGRVGNAALAPGFAPPAGTTIVFGEADPPWSTARDEAIPASTTKVAEMAKSKQKTVRNRDDAAQFGLAITDCLGPDCSMPQRSFTQKSTPLSIQSVPGKTSARAVAGDHKLLACGYWQSCRQH